MLLTLLSLYNVLFLSLITNIVWKPILSCYALAFKILEIYGFVRMFCKPLWTSHYSDFCLVSYLPPLSSTTSGSHKLKTLACNCIWQMPSGKRGFALALPSQVTYRQLPCKWVGSSRELLSYRSDDNSSLGMRHWKSSSFNSVTSSGCQSALGVWIVFMANL